MLYGFDTDDENSATGSLLIYAIWRSRDLRRFRVTPDVWARVERFSKAAAKRARGLPDFIEALKPRLLCGTISPRWMEVGIKGDISMLAVRNSSGGTEYIQHAADPEQREFLTAAIDRCDQQAVIREIYTRTAYCVLLVRDRLEREKPIEKHHHINVEEISDE